MQNSLPFVQELYNESKFWLGLAGLMWAVFKGFNWFKDLKTNDLANIQKGVSDMHLELGKQTNELKTGFDKQTSSIVSELKELRQDFRTYLAPIPPPQFALASRRSKVRKARKRNKK